MIYDRWYDIKISRYLRDLSSIFDVIGWSFKKIEDSRKLKKRILKRDLRSKKRFSGHIPVIGYLEMLESAEKNLREESLVSHYRESISREIITLWYLEPRNFFFLAILLRPRFGRFNIILFHDLTWEITSTFIQDMSNNNIHTFMP